MRCIVTMVIYLHKSYQTKMSLNVNNLKDFIECSISMVITYIPGTTNSIFHFSVNKLFM